MKKRIRQQKEVIEKNFTRNPNELVKLSCENDTHLTWEDAFDRIIDMENCREKTIVSYETLISIAKLLSCSIATDIRELGVNLTAEQIAHITRLLPVVYCHYSGGVGRGGGGGAFINLHEFVYTPGALQILIFPENIDEEVLDVNEQNDNENLLLNESSNRKGIGGQPSIIRKFPEIVDAVAEFIKQHGFAAQSRRRIDTGLASGVSIREIKGHLYEKFPLLKEHKISLSTISRMFEPPNRRIQGVINARVVEKYNSYSELHPDAHYLFERNKMRREMAVLFNDNLKIISMDDKAKVKVGAPAVSRYHRLKRLFPSSDNPNYSDHDFPVSGYFLNISG